MSWWPPGMFTSAILGSDGNPKGERKRMATSTVIETRRRWKATEVAEFLGVSARQVLRWAARRELACERLGPRSVRFRPADVEAFASARRVPVLRVLR